MALHYRESGSGPPVLLIHGIGAGAQAWDATAARLSARARVIAYDRRGYGASGAPEPYEGTSVYEQAEDAAHLLDSLATEPAVVAGDGFGALVALDLLLRHAGRVASAVLADPPLLAFVAQGAEVLSAQREQLVEAGSVSRGVVADFAGLSSWPVTRAQLRSIGAAVGLVTSPRTPPYVLAACDALAGLLPRVRRRGDGDTAAAVQALLEG